MILSHLIRDAAGGNGADLLRFARRELFDPLGMRDVTMEFDASGNRKDRARCRARARLGAIRSNSISTMAWPAASASSRRAG